ncbi:DUF2975 domain-containing protein [Streptacidiphilus sp. P02-A3a]|uniref:DUF2975 domain-containing protein n=1 Tax=Streptacidiphilus sp. P02-A3a TaxID=2704468 RepID=UPI0015FC437B|nr:DUF2975 domain-containing protein [Streptacidiphilus sp. P02-A3a]QMU73093.1 DUF2975 domain-containing protein [Streptacidiphilus sp. P02-A3a]
MTGSTMVAYVPEGNDIRYGMGVSMVIGKVRNPVEPLATTSRVALGGALAVIVFGVVAAVFGSNGVFGFGGDQAACLDVPSALVRFHGDGGTIFGLRSGVATFADSFNLCATNPRTSERLLLSLTEIPGYLLFVVMAVLVVRFTRTASRSGVYSGSSARQIRLIAWTLVLGEIIATGIEATASRSLFDAMTSYHSGAQALLDFWDFHLSLVFVSLGLLTFARIVSLGVRMREENEGTI